MKFKNIKGIIASVVMGGALIASPAMADKADYFDDFVGMKMSRDAQGILVVEMNTEGKAIKFAAENHDAFVDAFYAIARDRDNKAVILTGAGGEWMADIDFASFGNVADPDNWSKTYDEGTQVLENIANIRVPMICAVEGKAWVHTEYCLLSNIIVAANSATFNDAPHFAGGIIPGDGIFTTWSYRAGPGRAEAFLFNPKPLSAQEAKSWGVVSEVVADGKAVSRAKEIAKIYLTKPELTRRNTRIHFIQPLKEKIVREVGFGLSLEGASASALVKSFQQ